MAHLKRALQSELLEKLLLGHNDGAAAPWHRRPWLRLPSSAMAQWHRRQIRATELLLRRLVASALRRKRGPAMTRKAELTPSDGCAAELVDKAATSVTVPHAITLSRVDAARRPDSSARKRNSPKRRESRTLRRHV
jgi:hypothetical protein